MTPARGTGRRSRFGLRGGWEGRPGGAGGLGGGNPPFGLARPECDSPISKCSKLSDTLLGEFSSYWATVVLLQISISFSINCNQFGDFRDSFRVWPQTCVIPLRAAAKAHWPSLKVTQIVSPTKRTSITSPMCERSCNRAIMKLSSNAPSVSSFSTSDFTIIVPSGGPRSCITSRNTFSLLSGSTLWTSTSTKAITGLWSLCFNSARP